ncbi:hypothetical protein EJB05_15427, partial [Eragrostis curvula]
MGSSFVGELLWAFLQPQHALAFQSAAVGKGTVALQNCTLYAEETEYSPDVVHVAFVFTALAESSRARNSLELPRVYPVFPFY